MTPLKRRQKRYSRSMMRRAATAALATMLASVLGCHKSASPAPHAEEPPSARPDTRGPAPSAPPAARPSAAQGGPAAPGALAVHVDNLAAPMPGAAPSKLDVKATKGGLVVDMIEGLACDGSWEWRAHRAGPGRVTVTLSDENHSSVRSSCASMVHQRVTVSGLAPGAYSVHVAMPTGYGSTDRKVTVGH